MMPFKFFQKKHLEFIVVITDTITHFHHWLRDEIGINYRHYLINERTCCKGNVTYKHVSNQHDLHDLRGVNFTDYVVGHVDRNDGDLTNILNHIIVRSNN